MTNLGFVRKKSVYHRKRRFLVMIQSDSSKRQNLIVGSRREVENTKQLICLVATYLMLLWPCYLVNRIFQGWSKMSRVWILLAFFFITANADTIRLLECEPPDRPIGGGYGPILDKYLPGDTIHYYCDVDTFIGGNYLRKCEDNGDWTGNTPVCDAPSAFSSMTQTSTANEMSEADMAFDGRRDTCSSTNGAMGDQWHGTFLVPGELIRVMLFFQKGPVSFKVILVKENGSELECGTQTLNIVRYDWIFQNCPGPHNVNAKGVKIVSLSSVPLRICEIQAYVLTSPKCTDPHLQIENGYLEMDRKVASLTCYGGFIRSRHNQVECMQDGVWERRNLFCREPEAEEIDPDFPNRRPQNPDRERERVRGNP